jgi:hypothetical protein
MAEALRTPAESRMTLEGQQNAGGQRRVDDSGKPYFDAAPLSEYPRMMYRKTDQEQIQEYADAVAGMKDNPMVINAYGAKKLLCETRVADSLDEAEELNADGWETSPEAAHGLASGIAAARSAKDDRIAELEAMLAAQQASNTGEARRGPGRPPKVVDAA